MNRLLSYYYVSMCPIFLLFEDNCLKLKLTSTSWPVTRSFFLHFDVKHSSHEVVSMATLRAIFETMKSCCVVGMP